ncbi:uncharacterized protein WCC33_006698 [Rhinophrynus dorsalis]
MSSNHNDRNDSGTIQTQPQWQSESMASQYQSSKLFPIVPPGLKSLVEVEEVILKKKVFQTRSGQILYSLAQNDECCGAPLNLTLRDHNRRDVIWIHMIGGGCCEAYTDIISVPGSHLVAWIKREKEIASQIIFQFPMDMQATVKALILGTFLFINYRLREIYRERHSSSTSDSGWAVADACTWGDETFGGGGDWDGGDIGGGDCGGGGGGGGDCGGGGGGDCGGGGGDCGGGGGGDCGGGGD